MYPQICSLSCLLLIRFQSSELPEPGVRAPSPSFTAFPPHPHGQSITRFYGLTSLLPALCLGSLLTHVLVFWGHHHLQTASWGTTKPNHILILSKTLCVIETKYSQHGIPSSPPSGPTLACQPKPSASCLCTHTPPSKLKYPSFSAQLSCLKLLGLDTRAPSQLVCLFPSSPSRKLFVF